MRSVFQHTLLVATIAAGVAISSIAVASPKKAKPKTLKFAAPTVTFDGQKIDAALAQKVLGEVPHTWNNCSYKVDAEGVPVAPTAKGVWRACISVTDRDARKVTTYVVVPTICTGEVADGCLNGYTIDSRLIGRVKSPSVGRTTELTLELAVHRDRYPSQTPTKAGAAKLPALRQERTVELWSTMYGTNAVAGYTVRTADGKVVAGPTEVAMPLPSTSTSGGMLSCTLAADRQKIAMTYASEGVRKILAVLGGIVGVAIASPTGPGMLGGFAGGAVIGDTTGWLIMYPLMMTTDLALQEAKAKCEQQQLAPPSGEPKDPGGDGDGGDQGTGCLTCASVASQQYGTTVVTFGDEVEIKWEPSGTETVCEDPTWVEEGTDADGDQICE